MRSFINKVCSPMPHCHSHVLQHLYTHISPFPMFCTNTSLSSHHRLFVLFIHVCFNSQDHHQIKMSLWVSLPTLLQNPQFTNPSLSFIIDISFVPIVSSSIIVIATSFVDNASSHTNNCLMSWHFTITKSFTTNTSSCSTITISHSTSLSLALTLPHTWSIVILQRKVFRAKGKKTTKKRNP